MSLLEQLQNSIRLEKEKEKALAEAIAKGQAFFKDFNDNRMELAFSLFSEEMKRALFEIIFFLHVNDPQYQSHKFISTRIEKVYGVPKEVEYEETASLYVENAPHGVVGISDLSPIFKNPFEQYVHNELNSSVFESDGFAPIYSIASLGSIGTISHKKTASDLDLQVQYELAPFLIDSSALTDEAIEHCAQALIGFFSKKFRITKKLTPQQLKDAETRSLVVKAGHQNLKSRFPLLYSVIVQRKQAIRQAVLNSLASRQQLAQELIGVVDLHSKIFLKQERTDRERLLKEKIKRIQAYIQKKFPKAEVFLFAYSNDDYRAGKHGTTLESKEASGSAYELILNYEVLMPGIQFTPMIPIHFIMPDEINADRSQYEQLVNFIRFRFINLYEQYRPSLVDLGSTPPLTSEYMTAHSGAIYWESFKASSGNLPKATLNLLRFEMLFDPRFNTSVIELIKNPTKLDAFTGVVATLPEDAVDAADEAVDEFSEEADTFYDDYGLSEKPADDEAVLEEDVLGEEDHAGGMPIEQLLVMEKTFPALRRDPWWLRFKALKIGFGPENQKITDEAERDQISRIIDLGFALHMKISDIFANIREAKKTSAYREKVLFAFLDKAFPPSKRRYLEHITNGEVDAVIRFERELKTVFQRSMRRVQAYVDEYGGKDQTNQDENRIWYYYYEKNFNPPRNVIRRDILSDLKIPRGRLQIGINQKRKWFFRSIQKSTLAESRYDTFGLLDHLPDEVDLFEHESFLHGIAHCILNGYYGVINKGTLRESRTHLEYSVGHTEIGKASADKWAYIRPDIVERLVDRIDNAFPLQDYDFRDCIYKKKEIVNVFICLNLLEYGRVSFVYRDNLKTWYVDEIDHPPVEKRAQEMYQNPELFFACSEILTTIRGFFVKNSITDFTQTSISVWVNPNSLHTYHSADKYSLKEEELAREYHEVLFKTG